MKKQYEEAYDNMLNDKLGKKDPRYINERAIRTIEKMNDLEPSDAAKDFHNKANEYFLLVQNDAVNNFEAYLALDCDCPEKKDSIKAIAGGIYEKSINISNEMLDLQLEYMNKVGLKPTK